MKILNMVISGIVFAIVAMIVHTVVSMATMGYYMDPSYFGVWSNIMMPTAGPPPASFTVLSFLFNFIGGLLFVGVYDILKKAVPGKDLLYKGMNYGLLVFLVGSVPGYLAMALIINLPAGLITAWVVSSLVIYLINGIIVAKKIK